jgi:O-methyltransferase involved in polyketide biosynthesis
MLMAEERVHPSKGNETYLSTLYGKALDSRAPNPILGDTFADQAVRRIDFDFAKLKLPSGGQITLPMRAKQLDSWVREFLDAHPTSTVLHLGCGLDTRVFRVDPPATVRWYDVDLPDVIDLRERLYPERRDYEMIRTSVTDPHWLEAIPADRPVLVVAEGLVQYLTESDGIDLFRRITERFPSGQLIFDAYGRLTVRLINLAARLSTLGSKLTTAGTPVFLPWGIDDPPAIARRVPRLRLVTTVSFLTMPELVARLSTSPIQSLTYRWLERFGWYQRSIQHLRYEF